ncbi:hypothetical protein F8388_001107 [Cannabis sativa]|uniref:Uncharacterized protein n=1 Tax=Cannabis sativa TaxID=3483 RepID=A0A7J6EIK3_CANSA|nr:hypothetical protein F8388_001107 [Cannabis sativa]KAF4358268.1 hypothetical protein G4B88_027745 [Cannabis sativa]
MEEVLTNPIVGFYINRDVFGAKMVGVWAICLWEQIGKPKKICIDLVMIKLNQWIKGLDRCNGKAINLKTLKLYRDTTSTVIIEKK